MLVCVLRERTLARRLTALPFLDQQQHECRAPGAALMLLQVARPARPLLLPGARGRELHPQVPPVALARLFWRERSMRLRTKAPSQA